MCKVGNSNILKLKTKTDRWNNFNTHLCILNNIFLMLLNRNNQFRFSGKIITSLADIWQWKKSLLKLFSCIKFSFLNQFSSFDGTF